MHVYARVCTHPASRSTHCLHVLATGLFGVYPLPRHSDYGLRGFLQFSPNKGVAHATNSLSQPFLVIYIVLQDLRGDPTHDPYSQPDLPQHGPPNVKIERVATLLRSKEAPGSNLGLQTRNPGRYFVVFISPCKHLSG